MAEWKAASTADGRTYYYNKATSETTWTKPADFDDSAANPVTPATPSAAGASEGTWRETKTAEGKVYYYNTATRATSWTVPEGFQPPQQQSQQASGPAFVAGGATSVYGNNDGKSERRGWGRDDRGNLPQKPSFDGGRGDRPWEGRADNTDRLGFRGSLPAKTDEPEYATLEQAEDAFVKMLKRLNIDPEMPWKDALRSVVHDREFRAIKDPRERKEAYEKYCEDTKVQRRNQEREKKEKLREDVHETLRLHSDLKPWTRWNTIADRMGREVAFRAVENDAERKKLFLDYMADYRHEYAQKAIEQRRNAIDELHNLLRVLLVDPDISWTDADKVINENERFKTDKLFKSLHRLDIIRAFDTHIKELDREANDKRQREKQLLYRRQRQARDAFIDLLKQHVDEGKIAAGMVWSDYRDNVLDDERYQKLLENTDGSDPRELFWDVLEEEHDKWRKKRDVAYDELEIQKFEIMPDTPYEEYLSVMRRGRETSRFNASDLKLIFDRAVEKRLSRQRDREDRKKDDKREERKRAIDKLRSVIKHLDPPVRSGDKFEDVVPRIQSTEEFQALEKDEAARREAFDRHMDRHRRRDDDHDREKRRDRTKDHNGGSRRDDRERERRHRTRTPEFDPYEADRRKAQADRERQHRKPSFGLTPPPRDRRDDRDRRSRGSGDYFERERRERDAERERNYISRADPREKSRTLDYGDDDTASSSRPGSIRKRRDSDASAVSSRRDNKRLRRGHTRTPEPAVAPEEPPALQSGSEEGEIEEV